MSEINNLYCGDLIHTLETKHKRDIQALQIENAINQLVLLCNSKSRIKILSSEYNRCCYCKNLEKKQLTPLIQLSCSHSAHKTCLFQQTNEKYGYEDILCHICSSTLRRSDLINAVSEEWLQERDLDILKIQQEKMDQEERARREEANLKYQIKCAICMDDVNLNTDGITLNCDCKFCFDCLRGYTINKLKSQEISEAQLKCPNTCNKEEGFLDQYIIQYLLTKEDSDDTYEIKLENQQLYTKFLDIRARLYQMNTYSKMINCPGYFLRMNGQSPDDNQYYLLNQESIEGFRMKNSMNIPQGYTMHECKNAWEYDSRSNIKEFQCNYCKYSFCIFGCQKTHKDFTCQQFQQWIQQNQTVDAEFQKLVEQEKMVSCPKCGVYILKNQGCNHMTCRTPGCKKEFCYVCRADHPCGKH